MKEIDMNIKKLSLLPLVALALPLAANAAVVQFGTIGENSSFERVFNLDNSDYVSEQDIASDTLYFTLSNPASAVFYAKDFNYNNTATSNYEFRQIDILNTDLTVQGLHDNNWLASVGDYYSGLNGAAPRLTYNFQPGNYQVNFKSRGLESGFTGTRDSPTRVVGHAVEGLGDYSLGFIFGTGSAPVGADKPSIPIAANFDFPDTPPVPQPTVTPAVPPVINETPSRPPVVVNLDVPTAPTVPQVVADIPSAPITVNLDAPAVSAVPEPETYAMMLAGLGLIGFSARRTKTAKTA